MLKSTVETDYVLKGADVFTQADVDAARQAGIDSVTPEDGVTQADVDAARQEGVESVCKDIFDQMPVFQCGHSVEVMRCTGSYCRVEETVDAAVAAALAVKDDEIAADYTSNDVVEASYTSNDDVEANYVPWATMCEVYEIRRLLPSLGFSQCLRCIRRIWTRVSTRPAPRPPARPRPPCRPRRPPPQDAACANGGWRVLNPNMTAFDTPLSLKRHASLAPWRMRRSASFAVEEGTAGVHRRRRRRRRWPWRCAASYFTLGTVVEV